MVTKRLLCIVMTLALLLTGLAGCGVDPAPTETTKATETADFELLLEAADSIMPPENFASVEENAGVNMIARWECADVVSWYLELPADGTYTLRFVYSTDDNYEESKGFLYFDQSGPNGNEIVQTSLSFPATDSVDHFAIAQTTVDLKKGGAALTVENDFTDDTDFYFINLVKIQVCRGNVSAPDLENLSSPASDPDAMKGQLAGWWHNTIDGMISYFLVNEDETSVTLYDGDGYDVGPYDCRLEGDRFYTSFNGEEQLLILKDGQLFGPFDRTFVQWEKSEAPGFATAEQPNFDGSWYRCGDPAGGRYDISETEYRKMSPDGDSPAELGSGGLAYVYFRLVDNIISYPRHLKLELDNSDIELNPSNDNTILIEADFLDYAVYVREDLATEEMIPMYTYIETLLNHFIHEVEGPHYKHRSMYFTANSFFIRQDREEFICGKWTVADESFLELAFEDGTVEYVQLPAQGEPLYIEKVDTEFNFDF